MDSRRFKYLTSRVLSLLANADRPLDDDDLSFHLGGLFWRDLYDVLHQLETEGRVSHTIVEHRQNTIGESYWSQRLYELTSPLDRLAGL